jgi:hypothetical protein
MNISFHPGSEEIYNNIPCPVPTKYLIPQWYKNIPIPENFMNVKSCIPFLDTLSSGYTQVTWDDIHVKNVDNKLEVYAEKSNVISQFNIREKSDIEISSTFHKIELIWTRPWSVELPEGYSALVTHPINRYDLPFVTLSGIVDFDTYNHVKLGNIPFYIYSDFQGVIPKGTPMFQIIPIKREDWELKKELYDEAIWQEKEKKRYSMKAGAYKKMFWQRKRFD